MNDSHDTVRVAPASPGDAGQSPRTDAGVPGATRVEKQHSLPDGEVAQHARLPDQPDVVSEPKQTSGKDQSPRGNNQSQNKQPRKRTSAGRPQEKTRRKEPRRRGKNQSAQQRCYAAIDLGTNNCRLLIAKPTKSGFEVVDAFSRIVRLGEGLGTHNMLTDEAMDRTIAALRICASKMRRRNVVKARVVTTQACRHADNADVFMRRVARETGLELEVLSPEDEARLAVLGCAPLLDRQARRALVFDIGGGSTELVWLDLEDKSASHAPDLLAWASLPVGVVTLADRYDGRTVNRTGYEAMVSEVRSLLHDRPWSDELDAQISDAVEAGDIHLLGTSGTVTTIAGIHLGLKRYDRSKVDGIWVDFADVTAVTDGLSIMNFDERASVPCIGKERADLVLAGCAILEAIQTSWPCKRLRVADRGLREGILITLMREERRNQKRKRRRRRGGRGRRKPGSQTARSPSAGNEQQSGTHE